MSEKNINENADLDFIRSVLDDKKSNGENITIPTETLDESAYTNQPSEETVKTPRKRAPKKVEDDGEPFEEKMERLTKTLSEQFARSRELEDEIRKQHGGIGYEL